MINYSGVFAGQKLKFKFRDPLTASFYGKNLYADVPDKDSIVIPEKDIREWMDRWNAVNHAYAEYVLSCSYACDRLMRADRMVFHAVSMLWRGKAFLFTAPSGTGKTTQYRLWKSLYPDEVDILNGDKPIIEISSENRMIVHPSPWKGKEGLGRDDLTVPLGGIILLRQDSGNSIEQIAPLESARNLFGRICSTFNAEEEVLLAARLLERVIDKTPVWCLHNKGDEASAKLTHDALSEYRKQSEESVCTID